MAAAASSTKVRPAAGPEGVADEQADNSISKVNTIADMNTSPLQKALTYLKNQTPVGSNFKISCRVGVGLLKDIVTLAGERNISV